MYAIVFFWQLWQYLAVPGLVPLLRLPGLCAIFADNDSCLSTSISKPSSQCRGNCTVECSITVGCSISSAPQICWRKDNTTLMNEVSSVLSIGQDIPGHYSCDVTVPYNVDGLSTQGNLMKSSSIRLSEFVNNIEL